MDHKRFPVKKNMKRLKTSSGFGLESEDQNKMDENTNYTVETETFYVKNQDDEGVKHAEKRGEIKNEYKTQSKAENKAESKVVNKAVSKAEIAEMKDDLKKPNHRTRLKDSGRER